MVDSSIDKRHIEGGAGSIRKIVGEVDSPGAYPGFQDFVMGAGT